MTVCKLYLSTIKGMMQILSNIKQPHKKNYNIFTF